MQYAPLNTIYLATWTDCFRGTHQCGTILEIVGIMVVMGWEVQVDCCSWERLHPCDIWPSYSAALCCFWAFHHLLIGYWCKTTQKDCSNVCQHISNWFHIIPHGFLQLILVWLRFLAQSEFASLCPWWPWATKGVSSSLSWPTLSLTRAVGGPALSAHPIIFDAMTSNFVGVKCQSLCCCLLCDCIILYYGHHLQGKVLSTWVHSSSHQDQDFLSFPSNHLFERGTSRSGLTSTRTRN